MRLSRLFVVFLLFCCSSGSSGSLVYAKSFSVPTTLGEEVTVNVYPSTMDASEKPLLLWFTEGYADRTSFHELLGLLNDLGFSVWQVDLLESYFLERTPTNVRKLSGDGVAAVLQAAQQQGTPFVPISTGRMSLVLLRGARLWQLADLPPQGVGNLLQTVLFFPNLYDAAEKAGDAPQFFPIVSASSLPITLVQPSEGTYRWKIADLQNALQKQGSQVTIAMIPKMRDWYFLGRKLDHETERARDAIPQQLMQWLSIALPQAEDSFAPLKSLPQMTPTERLKGLVEMVPRSASNFELIDANGHSLNLADKRGKVVLLNFWASWCPPCVKEIPSMNRLAESFDEKTFEIVSVNFKETPQVIMEFMQKVQVDFPVLMDLDGKVSADYEIFSFPSSFLIDAKGQLRYSVNAAIEWDEADVKKVIQTLISTP